MASQNAKKMAKEFLQNVEKDCKSYHKSWARKFGNKYQSAKNWVKRDKKMVAMDIAQKGVRTGIGMIPFPGSKEGAALLEVAGGAALKAASRKAWEEGSKKGVKSLLNKKIESARKQLKTNSVGKVDHEFLALSARKRDEHIHAIRKLVKYEVKLLPKRSDELSLRLFKLKEAINESRVKLNKTNMSSTSAIDNMQAWTEFFSAIKEVEHYQAKLRESLIQVQEITKDVEWFLAASEATTDQMNAQNLPQLEEAFDQIRRSYGNINSLKQLQDMMLERNLVESGLLDEKDLTYKLVN
ncbi:hypothetical protein MKR81_08050 [Vibrio campbellii]|uniref:hypothetical protein n=1 Tax=Vibrio campbellii TaxID=680 RepID=UPI001F0778FB|nr:hypothetical protein [Vibrio campbellii]UMM04529.1 hypothetical protein MKR81_08050 [Vibrio campbellii]